MKFKFKQKILRKFVIDTNSYEEFLSKKLYEEVKVLCMIITQPKNHKTRAIFIKNTWGKRCNKLLFMSSQKDKDLDVTLLPIKESRDALWNKTKASFLHLYKHYRKDYDYFIKADDDK